MNNHLSQDEFAKCAAGRSTSVELQHLRECGECSAELERFGSAMSLFRTAIKERINDRVASNTSSPPEFSIRPAEAAVSKWGWAFAAAVVVLVVLPVFNTENEPREVSEQLSIETNPNAIMDAMNRHLSRIVPAPMEPMMAVIPGDPADLNAELTTESGGVQ